MRFYLISLSFVIAAVLLVRALLRRHAPQRAVYALWLAVALRLCIPGFLFTASMSAFPERPVEIVSPSPGAESVPPEQREDASAAPETDAPGAERPLTWVSGETISGIPETDASPAVSDPPADEARAPFSWRRAAVGVWIGGSALLFACFAYSAVRLNIRLRRDRVPVRTVRRTKVYRSAGTDTPCLAGLIPAIYLPAEPMDARAETLSVIHEYTHLRHVDFLWTAMRAAALVFLWWNPLVWAAAILSRHDAELACDEAMAAKLNDAERLAYARAIVDSIPQRGGLAVGLGGAPVAERIRLLTQYARRRVFPAVLAACLTAAALGCSLGRPEDTSAPGVESAGTSTPESGGDTSDTSLPASVRVTENPGGMQVRAVTLPLPSEDAWWQVWDYDGRYKLILTYEVKTVAWNEWRYESLVLYMLDVDGGALARLGSLPATSSNPSQIAYTENGCILHSVPLTEDGRCAYVVLGADGAFTLGEASPSYPLALMRVSSPDGTYTAYRTDDDGTGNGGIDIRMPDGERKRILTNVMLEETDLAGVTGYVPVGFTDDTHLAYHIGGWEWTKGWGIYDLENGTKIERLTGEALLAAADGYVYIDENPNISDGLTKPGACYRISADGTERVRIDGYEEKVGVMSSVRYVPGGVWWQRETQEDSEEAVMTFYAADMREKLAVLTVPCSYVEYQGGGDVFCHGRNVTVVTTAVGVPAAENVGTGPFAGYVADAETEWIDLYAERFGAPVARIPYAVIEQFPATQRYADDPASYGWRNLDFYYGTIGDFAWAAAASGPNLGTGNHNVCTSRDGGNTWWIADRAAMYSGTCTGAGFSSETVGFLCFRY